MKPYLAILIDSFWEAVTSKVLWALLIGWSLLLAGLAPFGYITENSYQLSRGDVRNRTGLALKLAKGLTIQATPSQKAVSERLGADLKKQLEVADKKVDRETEFQRISARLMVAELNKLLKDRELYSPEAFPTAAAREPLKPIIETSPAARSEADIELLNRALIQIVYSADLASPRSEQLWIGYAGLKLGDALPISRRQVNSIVERIALEVIIRLGLSFITVFVGLIVTSPMIPETFRSGSLHLLLSKPISRPLVYLTKFFGGTLFVLVNIAFLLTGLFILVGWRLGIWNVGLLWCIPLLLFVFVIFYSVSALVGVIWNNPIICVVVCIVFWVFCLVIGVLESALRMPAQWKPQIVRLQEVEEEVVAVTQAGMVNVWNEQFKVWQPAADLDGSTAGRVLGPIYDAKRKRLVMRSDFMDGMGGFQTNARNLVYADLSGNSELTAELPSNDAVTPALESNDPSQTQDGETNPTADVNSALGSNEIDSSGTKTLNMNTGETNAGEPNAGNKEAIAGAVSVAMDDSQPRTVEDARRKQRWPSENGVEPPMLMLDLLVFDGKSLAVTRNGIYELDWAMQDALEKARSSGMIGNIFSSLMGRFQPQPFKDLTPVDYTFGDNIRVAATADQQLLFVYNNGKVDGLRLDLDSGKFKVAHSTKLEGEERQSGLIAAGSQHTVVARENSPLLLFPRDLDGPANLVSIPGGSDVRQITAISTGDRFSIVTHAGEWFTLDGQSASLTRVVCPWQGSISGASWIGERTAWVGVKPNRAALFNVTTGTVERLLVPTMSRLDMFYHWLARPLYLLNPKPSSLNGVLQTLLSRESAGQTQLINNDLAAARVEVEIWQPIISNLIFVAVLLSIGCIYVWRREF